LQDGITFYWRVRAIENGWAGPWSVVFNFTRSGVILTAPVQTAPPTGTIGVALTPLLTWDAVIGANAYRVEIATDTSFGGAAVLFDVVKNQVTLPTLKANQKYYWRVRALEGPLEGDFGPFSAVWNFTTGS
jgi:hypothetical protein